MTVLERIRGKLHLSTFDWDRDGMKGNRHGSAVCSMLRKAVPILGILHCTTMLELPSVHSLERDEPRGATVSLVWTWGSPEITDWP
jgi:hypothetical protein